jgi:quercetin dioxygenase-like cupin family protein
MQAVKIAKLSETHLHFRMRGASEFLVPDFSGGTKQDGVIDWDPGLEGALCGEALMTGESDHAGERHLDGDEILYLISGSMRLMLFPEDGPPMATPLKPGEAVIVPRGIWHRIEADEPSRFLFMGGGHTQIRLRK